MKKDTNKAVALFYDGQNAPEVCASGENEIATEIIRLACEYGVPLYENQELVELLSQIELDEQIPSSLYHCIAEVIAFAYYLKGKTPAI